MKRKIKDMETVARIAILGTLKLNKWKSDELDLIASHLGSLRAELWNEFGSLKAWGVSKFDIDKAMRPNRSPVLPAKLWDSTLYDVIDDIHLVQAACIEKVMKALGQKYQKAANRKTVLQFTLESRDWMQSPCLRKLVRKYWYRGHTKVSNQIILRAFDTKKDANGLVWLRFGGLVKGKTIKIPTTLKSEITCQLRLIKRDDRWEIHYTTDIQKAEKKKEGLVIGCDRGYTEVYATSSNDESRFLGNDFGAVQTRETDYRTAKQVKRNKIRSIAKKAVEKGNPAKSDRIVRNNLGKKKWDKRENSFKGHIKTLVFTATHALMRNAMTIAYEDLTEQIKSKKPMSKRVKRNVSGWCKGVVADALDRVSARTGCTVVGVNCAYTSQLDSRFGTLTGERKGDRFTGHDGVVMHSDTNAADNVLVRMGDAEITRYMKYSVARVILLERTRKFQESLTPTWEEIFGAITEKDNSQSLEPRRRKARRVNQAVNKSKQLTLFDFG